MIRILRNSKVRDFGLRQRLLSSAALAYDHEVELAHESKPRLEALRERLKQDKTDMVWRQPKKTTQMQPKNNEESLSVHDILDQIRHLPHPDDVLMDRFDRSHSYLRISLSERCNLRCRYCMPPDGVPLQPESHLLQRDEILSLATLFAKHGVDKVRLTGGEPLLRKDLAEIVSGISQLDGVRQVGMTTNGVTLHRQLPTLIDAGLSHVNISLDTLVDEKFTDLTRRPGLSKVWKSLEAASKQLPSGRVKVNCVVMKGVNDNELIDFCKISQQLPVDIRFIEWMPFSENGWSKGRLVPYKDMLKAVEPLKLQRVEDGPNDTTKWWRMEGGLGRIGFITSMSQHFCGTCNRLRLTSDGKIKVCLFGATELSLRDAMRSGVDKHDMEKLIHYAVQRKHFALGGHGSAEGIVKANDNRPMTLIGG